MDKKLTDSEIVKAKELIKKLEEAYDNYYDSSKGIPYDIDTTLLHSAICFKNCLNEINRQEEENERLKNDVAISKKETKRYMTGYKTAKAEAYKEFAERLKGTFPQDDSLRSTKRISEDIDNLLKELIKE